MSLAHHRREMLSGGFILAGLGFIVLVAWLNRFPEGTIFAGGDVTQYFDKAFVEANLRHVWSRLVVGEGYFSPSFLYYPFYAAVFGISDVLRLDASAQSMVYMVLLWGGAYVGWLLASSLPQGQAGSALTAEGNLSALLYALNPYTFYAFYFIWGYSPFLFLYAVFPVIAVATLEYFCTQDRGRSARLLALLFLAHVVASIAYANLPFFVGMNVVLGGIVCIERLLKRERARTFLIKALAYIAVEVAAVAWAIVPQVPNFLLDSNPLAGETNFSHWILWQRLPIWQIVSLNPQYDRYLENAAGVAILALVVFVVALAAWILRRHAEDRRARPIALLCGVALIVLVESKGRDIIPGALAIWAFSNPVMGALRSNGKVAIFLPFLLLLIMSTSLSSRPRAARLWMLGGCLAAFLLSAYPMLLGTLQTEYSVGMKQGEDCETAQYCYLNRIPQDYADAAAAIRRDGANGKILSLPYSTLNSPNWAVYPVWKHIGVDPTTQLFPLPVVQISQHQDLFGYPYGHEWEAGGANNPEPLLTLAAEVGAAYLLFHRDVPRQFVHPAEEYLRSYEKLNALVPMHESRFLTVYGIPDAYRRPLLAGGPGPAAAEEVLELDATRRIITMRVRPGVNEVVMRETFSTQWQALVLPPSRAKTFAVPAFPWWESFVLPALPESSHTRFARYANRWTFDGDALCHTYGCLSLPEGGRQASLMIEYAPQRLVYLLQLLGLLAALACVVRATALSRRGRANARSGDSDTLTGPTRAAGAS